MAPTRKANASPLSGSTANETALSRVFLWE